MEDATPLQGSFTDPATGQRRSARIAALQAAVNAGDKQAVADVTAEDATQAFKDATMSGSSRKMRGGGPEIDAALIKIDDIIRNKVENVPSEFDMLMGKAINTIPDFFGNYGRTLVEGVAVGAVVKYPTVFARLIAFFIRMVPVPSGAGWAEWTKAAGFIVDALATLGINVTVEALSGPLLGATLAIYTQRLRAKASQMTFWERCVEDGKKVAQAGAAAAAFSVPKIISFLTDQKTKYDEAFAQGKLVFPIAQLKELAEKAVPDATTPGLEGKITGVRIDKETGVLLEIPPKLKGAPKRDEEGNRIREGGPKSTASTVKKGQTLRDYFKSPAKGSEGPASGAPPTTPARPQPMETGGRRRKTRKPKRVRRVTRRRRAIVY